MKWSMFIIKVNTKKSILLYNTFNNAIVELEVEIYEEITKNLNDLKLNDTINNLIKLEFLLKNDVDEKELFIQSLEKEWKNDTHLAMHILPTTACNFKCPYCYQSGIEQIHFLDEEKLKQTLKYIKKYLEINHIEKSTVVLHGGEPTMYWDAVTNLLPSLDKIFKENEVSYSLQIVSNGYKLTKEKADYLSNFNWKRFQVTLDGPEEIHNKRRILKNDGKTFRQIIANIEYILKNDYLQKVSLRINYDKNNIEYIPEFLEEIKDKFGTDRIALSLGFISKTIDDTEANDYIKENGILESEIKDTYIKMHKKARELGFKLDDLFMFDGMCTAKLSKAMVISADGKIYKCLSGVGREEFVVSDINKENYQLENYLFLPLYDDCFDKKCEYIPLCNTGCRFNAYLLNGKINSIACKREALTKINNNLLKDIYLGE